jgi:hypothetical protein
MKDIEGPLTTIPPTIVVYKILPNLNLVFNTTFCITTTTSVCDHAGKDEFILRERERLGT